MRTYTYIVRDESDKEQLTTFDSTEAYKHLDEFGQNDWSLVRQDSDGEETLLEWIDNEEKVPA